LLLMSVSTTVNYAIISRYYNLVDVREVLPSNFALGIECAHYISCVFSIIKVTKGVNLYNLLLFLYVIDASRNNSFPFVWINIY
jgi:hypothetical protein